VPIDSDDIPTLDPPGTLRPTPSPSNQHFAPRTILASRYRIVSRVGKGGMREVFRADDLVLGQSVALKFLPQTARGNHNLLTRFYEAFAAAPISMLAADGDLDSTFGVGVRVRYEESSAYRLFAGASAIQPDGKIIVSGSIGAPPNGADFVLLN
jgi:hypothetical protein